jgi:hypothetical protein
MNVINMPAYTTAFDYSRDGWRDLYGFIVPIFLTFVTFVFCRFVIYPKYDIARWKYPRTIGSYALMIIPLIFLAQDGWAAADLYFSLRYALATGAVSRVEGLVENYQPWVPHVSGESFSVGGINFSMWDSRSSAFDDMPIELHDGERVRITYVEDSIVRLEVLMGHGAQSLHPEQATIAMVSSNWPACTSKLLAELTAKDSERETAWRLETFSERKQAVGISSPPIIFDSRPLELTRFSGHFRICGEGVHHGKASTELSTGVSAPDHRVSSFG